MTKHKPTKMTSDGLAILDAITGHDSKLRADIAAEVTNLRIASAVCELRARANLSREALARRIGADPAVISQLEQAEYESDPLPVLQRIAAALDKRLEVRFVPARKKLQHAET